MRPPMFAMTVRRLLQALALLIVLAGCASKPPQPASAPGSALRLAEAVDLAMDRLLEQADRQRAAARGSDSRLPRVVEILPMREAPTTEAAESVRKRAVQALGNRRPGYAVQGSEARAGTPAADLRLDARLTAAAAPGSPGARDRFVLELRLTDAAGGALIAQSFVEGAEPGLLAIAQPAAPRGGPAAPTPEAQAPATEVQRAVAASAQEAASQAYAANRMDEALQTYRAAGTLPGADQTQARIGEYRSLVRMGREAEASETFARMVEAGLRERKLGVRLLFAPASTRYWPDPTVSGPYAGWLQEIARQTLASPLCLELVGHSSPSSVEARNKQLSLQRAQTVRQQLIGHAAELAPRLRVSGAGSRQSLLRTGSNDARDAIDRRVEFKVVDCR